jgi:hypothetical protein
VPSRLGLPKRVGKAWIELFIFGGFATAVPLLTSFMATFASLSTSLRAVCAAFLLASSIADTERCDSDMRGLRVG